MAMIENRTMSVEEFLAHMRAGNSVLRCTVSGTPTPAQQAEMLFHLGPVIVVDLATGRVEGPGATH